MEKEKPSAPLLPRERKEILDKELSSARRGIWSDAATLIAETGFATIVSGGILAGAYAFDIKPGCCAISVIGFFWLKPLITGGGMFFFTKKELSSVKQLSLKTPKELSAFINDPESLSTKREFQNLYQDAATHYTHFGWTVNGIKSSTAEKLGDPLGVELRQGAFTQGLLINQFFHALIEGPEFKSEEQFILKKALAILLSKLQVENTHLFKDAALEDILQHALSSELIAQNSSIDPKELAQKVKAVYQKSIQKQEEGQTHLPLYLDEVHTLAIASE